MCIRDRVCKGLRARNPLQTGDDHNYSDLDRADAQYPPPQSRDHPVLLWLDPGEKWKREILKAKLHRQESRLCVLLLGGL